MIPEARREDGRECLEVIRGEGLIRVSGYEELACGHLPDLSAAYGSEGPLHAAYSECSQFPLESRLLSTTA